MKEEIGKNKRSFIFYFSIVSFALGIFISSFFTFSLFFLFSASISTFLVSFLFFIERKKYQYPIWSIFLFLLFLFSGFLFSQEYQKKKVGSFDYLLHKKIQTEMIVADEVLEKTYYTKVTARIEDSKDKIIMKAPQYPMYQYGDRLRVEGYLVEIENFKNDLGRDFDYKNYLRKDAIFYEIKNPQIEYMASGEGNIIKEKLFTLKQSFLSRIKKTIPDPESSLLGGLLLGAKENMDEQTLEDFRRTGVIHIVVLSGYNLTIVAEFIMAVLAFMGFTFSALVGSLAIVLFAIMTGASATIIRASIMALIVIFAKLAGRESEAIKALFLAGFLMLLANPMILVHDPSFQLSFLATLGLLTFSPFIEKVLEKRFWFKTRALGLRTLIAATLSTSIFVVPLLLYMMGEISVISPLVNLLILVFVPLTMLFGFLAVIFSYFIESVSWIFSFLAYIFLHYDIVITGFFSQFSFATVSVKNFPFWTMALVYLVYGCIYLGYKTMQKKRIEKSVEKKVI